MMFSGLALQNALAAAAPAQAQPGASSISPALLQYLQSRVPGEDFSNFDTTNYANLNPDQSRNLDPQSSDWYRDASALVNQHGVSGFGDMWRNGQWRPGLYPNFNNDTSNWLSEQLKNWQAAADPGSWEDSVKNFVSNPANLFAAGTTGLGGMTGANLATGGDVGKGVLTDIAGLGAGVGLAQALPALGLSAPAATAAAGGTALGTGVAAAGAGGAEVGALGSGLTTGGTTSSVGGGALGSGLTGGATTGAVGGGGLGNGLALGTGAAGAGALGSGYFGSETAAPVIGGATAAAAGGLAGQLGSGAASGLAAEAAGSVPQFLKDYGSILGPLIGGGLGYLGASQQTDAYKELAQQYMGMGAPYRDKLSNLYTPEGIKGYLSSPEVTTPVDQGTSAVARALSTRGNPAGSGSALQELQNYSSNMLYGKLGQERDRLAGYGGLTQYNAAAPNASGNAIQSQGNEWSSIGYGLGRALNPQPTFADFARMFRIPGPA